jgi:cytochrome c-type biogenesis protein CcmE
MQGSVVSGGVALASIIGLAAVFMLNASPYVTVDQAVKGSSDGAHVVGNLEAGTVKQKPGSLDFTIQDETGKMPVSYTGPSISLETATKVVVIGKYENGVFQARDMQVKCPSKYQAAKKAG